MCERKSGHRFRDIMVMQIQPVFTGEIIGPSGAGKSTLSNLLNSMNAPIVAGITIWGLPRWILAKSSFVSFPAFVGMVIEDGAFNIENGKQIIRLHAFYDYFRLSILRKRTIENGVSMKPKNAFFLDEGVVFALTKINTEHQNLQRSLKQWEKNVLNRWSKMLDTIVWLDAPNSILIERIRSRSKSHRMKYESDDKINEFLTRYRAAYLRTVTRLQARGNLRVLKFDTQERSPESIADELIGFLDTNESGAILKSS